MRGIGKSLRYLTVAVSVAVGTSLVPQLGRIPTASACSGFTMVASQPLGSGVTVKLWRNNCNGGYHTETVASTPLNLTAQTYDSFGHNSGTASQYGTYVNSNEIAASPPVVGKGCANGSCTTAHN